MRNGAGKTTTVRTLGTLIAPTSGSATVAGIPLTPENGVEIRRRISIMPESPGLYLRLSVVENLECFADLYEVPEPERSHRPRAAGRQPRRPGQRSLRHAVQGPAPAGRPGPGAAQRPGGAVPRRADLRPRPGRRPRRPRADRRAPQQRRDDLPHHAPPRGGRAPLRPGRDPEHDPAHDRPARRAARAAVRQDAHGQDRSPRSPIRTASSAASRRSTAGSQDGAGDYVLTVSDPAVAAPGGHPGAGGGRRRRALDRRVAPLARGRLPRADRRGRGGETGDEHEPARRDPGHLPQGAPRVPAQPLHRRRRWRSSR